jgi:predicted DNA-binding ribbon-helix-helix protein
VNNAIRKHSIMLNGHKTSVSLEDAFWQGLCDIATGQKRPVSKVINEIDTARGSKANLSSAVRLYVLGHFLSRARARAAEGIRQPPEPLVNAA